MELLNITDDQQATLEFLLQWGMIDEAPLCSHCGKHSKLVYETNRSGNLKPFWMCRNQGISKHKFNKSVVRNSFFKGSKLNLQQLLRIIYCFCAKSTNEFVVGEFGISEETVVDWYSYLRQVCLEWAVEKTRNGQKIGGAGKAVEIDESMFGKRKFNQGRKTKGSWVVGGVESKIEIGDWSRTATSDDYARAKRACTRYDSSEETKDMHSSEWPSIASMDAEEQTAWRQWEDARAEARALDPQAPEDDVGMFMFVVDDRTKDTLYPIIEDNVAPKTLIITDCYSTYKKLDQMVDRNGVPLEYKHLTVNHRKTFKDPITSACTNRIEGYWRHAKKSLPYGGTKKDMLPLYLARFIWFRYVSRHNLNPFDFMLECIKKVQYVD